MKNDDPGLRRHEFGDPLKILIDRENRSCKGCKFEQAGKVFGVEIRICGKGRKHGKRCVKYKEKE